jgi:acylphosphatase
MERIEAIVSGRVQGVMFRDFACRKGRALDLSGEAANLPDGTVRVIAEGEREALERFIKKLNAGSFLSSVEAVAVSWRPATGAYRGFAIGRA